MQTRGPAKARASLFAALLGAALCTCAPQHGARTCSEELATQYPFYEVATTRFAPVYPALSRQIIGDYRITRGVCVDLGGGAGWLAMELARRTQLVVYVLDIDPKAVALGQALVRDAGLEGRVRFVQGDATRQPFRDELAELVVSRGSIFFWSDPLAGLTEAHRILKPGGVAFIGGGFSRKLHEEQPATFDALVRWRKKQAAMIRHRGWRPIGEELVKRARASGIEHIRLIREPGVGVWIEMKKPSGQARGDP